MNDEPHVLVVDDDAEIRDLLSRFLKRNGYRVMAVRDGTAMAEAIACWNFDLVVLDIMLPGEDGLSLCRAIRGRSKVPVIMLSAMGDETDRIVGLEVGADDYIAKPFNPRELLARIRAVLRRGAWSTPEPVQADGTILHFAGCALDLGRRTLTKAGGEVVHLTGGEFDLLLALAQRPHRVLSREQLLDLAKGRGAQPFDRSIDAQVSRLRRKIESDPNNPILIKTVRGGGYLFAEAVT
ncbi:response regulator [Zavarzinia sp. CC-PAN008]|uniref:response regulator n=1 Tax=Zavarzinia sp. CC-PAN008 TaxID=3243332 RepID=UPI003F7437E0